MIATLTLNPAIDKSTEVGQLIPEKKLRCSEMILEAGGGGINVSKALVELGVPSFAVFLSGGVNGKLLEQLLGGSSIQLKPVEINGNTRESLVVTETSTNRQYKFIVPGPAVSTEELAKIKSAIEDLQNVSFLVCSGSLPPNTPDDLLAEIAVIARRKGIKFIIDTSGTPLKKALSQGVYLVKPSMSELCSLVNKEYIELHDLDDAVDQVFSEGLCEVLVVSMGPAGAMLATKELKKRFPAPMVKKSSTVGAGDSMLAGITWMLDQNKSLEEAVQFGIACGSAAAVTKGSQLFNKEDAVKFYEWIKAQKPM
jgi:6-phosphofructokinase 2